jgi:hypothetical protein
MNIGMGKASEVFQKTCKKGKACGNACIAALKKLYEKTGESTTQSTKKKTGESTTQSTKKTGESTQPSKTAPVSYKADSSDHKALMNIGKDFSDQTMGKALKALEDAQAEKKKLFMDIETNNKKTKKGEWFKKDEKRLKELDEKMLLAQKEFGAAAEETLQKLKAHHKIDKKDGERWANSVDTSEVTSENKEITFNALAEVYAITGGKGAKNINKVSSRSFSRASTNQGGELRLERTVDRQQVFHEYAHHLEFENRQLAVASRKFIEDQSTSSEPMQLNKIQDSTGWSNSKYRDDEMGFPGNFITPYVGKIYGPAGNPTEVISVGIEQFADPSRMAVFYKKYPEHFNFILGAILHEN